MTITAYRMGHKIWWDTIIEWWRYEDTGEPIPRPKHALERPCTLCNQPPTPDGHDPCLGTISGAKAACCGHGVQPGYVVWVQDNIKSIAPKLLDGPPATPDDWKAMLVTNGHGHGDGMFHKGLPVGNVGDVLKRNPLRWEPPDVPPAPCQAHGFEYCPCQEEGWQEGDTIVIIDRAYIKRACGCVLDDDRQPMIACEEHNPNNVYD